MRFNLSLAAPLRWLSVALLLVFGVEAYGADSYSAGNLTVGSMTLGNATYSAVTMPITLADIQSGPLSAAPFGSSDSYNPAKGLLTIPSVAVGSNTFNNVVVTTANVGTQVTVGSVSGADSYAGGKLTISYVQVNSKIYQDVVVSGLTGISVAGGMPNAPWDVYTPSGSGPGGTLSIPAAVYNGHVYTNVTATLPLGIGNVVSIGNHILAQQSIQFQVTGVDIYIPLGFAGTLAGSASSGLPVTYAVQTPSLCAVAQSTPQEQYIYVSWTATGGTNGSAILGGSPETTGVFQINSVNGTTATGQSLGLLSTLDVLPASSKYYLAPYTNYQIQWPSSNPLLFWFWDDILYANGSPLFDADGIIFTAPGDYIINLAYYENNGAFGYWYGDSVLYDANGVNGTYVSADSFASEVNGVVALGDGICVVTAFQGGNGTYAAAPPVTVSVEVGSVSLP